MVTVGLLNSAIRIIGDPYLRGKLKSTFNKKYRDQSVVRTSREIPYRSSEDLEENSLISVYF
jgi:hypothetical protein